MPPQRRGQDGAAQPWSCRHAAHARWKASRAVGVVGLGPGVVLGEEGPEGVAEVVSVSSADRGSDVDHVSSGR